MESIYDYKRVEFELHEYLVQLKDMLTLLKGSELFLDKIEQNIEYIKSKRFQAAVIGEFKRGKSSLLNALLGADILPSDIEPATATINRITYGSEASAAIHYRDGTSEKADINRLSEFVTKLTKASDQKAGRVKEALITYPVEICRNNIELIDTPGLNDDERMTEITLDMVSCIDAAIVTISAISPVSRTEQALIARLIKGRNVGCVLFVVTYIDQIDEEDRERLLLSIRQRICTDTLKLLQDEEEEVLQKAHRILDDIKLFGVSSKMALKAISMNKQISLQESGFLNFRNALYQTLIAEQGLQAIRKSIQSIYEMVKELENQYQSNINQYNEELKKIEQLIRSMDQYKSSYLNPLDGGFAKADTAITLLINSFADVKVKLIQFFILALSALTSSSNEDIMNAIARATNQCNEFVNGVGSSDIKSCIARELFSVILSYKSAVDTYLADEGGQPVDNDQTNRDLPLYSLPKECVLDPVSLPEFILIIKPMAMNRNLAEHNIIGDIKEDINQAVSVYINRWNLFVRQYRLWCFSQAEREMKFLYDYMIQRSAHETKSCHMQLQINDANYEMSRNVTKEILENVQALQKNLNIQIE